MACPNGPASTKYENQALQQKQFLQCRLSGKIFHSPILPKMIYAFR
jgi:hypothetical protein